MPICLIKHNLYIGKTDNIYVVDYTMNIHSIHSLIHSFVLLVSVQCTQRSYLKHKAICPYSFQDNNAVSDDVSFYSGMVLWQMQ